VESIDIGLLAVRLVAGGLLLGHGLAKFGWLRGFGIDGSAAIFERLGYRPGRPYVIVAAVTEIAAGGLLALGLATPLAAAAFVGVMVNTIGSAHAGKGPWYFNDGWEYNVTLLTAAAALAFTGAGDVALDAALGLDLAGWGWGLGALALGLVSGLGVLQLRRLPATTTEPEDSPPTATGTVAAPAGPAGTAPTEVAV
jgi:putative oxidoreductase